MPSASLATAPPPPLRILAFGDSLVAGYRLPHGSGFAPQLERALRESGFDASVINAGVSGNTAGAARARLERTLAGLRHPPDLAMVALGGNDMLRGIPPQRTRADLEAILATFRSEDVPVVLAEMVAPFFLGPSYAGAFNALYPELAARYGAALYPFFLAGVAGNPRLNLPDRMHPNAAGIERMVKGITPLVRRALEARARARI